MITATFTRESPEIKLGISLQKVNGHLVVAKLTPYGVVATQTDLCVGHRIIMINNVDCTEMSVEEAIVILKTTLGTVTILADNTETPVDTKVVVARAEPIHPATYGSATTQPQHPPGKPEGGVWGTNQYIGNFTAGAALVGCLCFCLPGLLVLCCPCDERDAYKVDGKVYDAAGNYIGPAQNVQFIPKHVPMQR